MKSFKITNLVILFLAFSPFMLRGQWIKNSFPSNENLNVVRFSSPKIGWILGDEHVFKTTDGGETWVVKNSVESVWKGLYVIDDSTVIYPDNHLGIIRTSDGGASWNTVDNTKKDVVSFDFLDSELGFASGGIGDTMTVYKTIDGGKTWNRITNGFIVKNGWDFEKADFIDSLQGWAATYGGEIYHTTDGGLNWSLQDNTSQANQIPLRDIQFTTADSGWAVGGISGTSILLRTTNGGTTWESSTFLTNFTSADIREIHMLNSKTGWFVGGSNGPAYIAKTSDGGVTWIDQTPGDYDPRGFKSVDMVNDSLGFLVGNNGGFYRTNTGGISDVQQDDTGINNQFSLSQNYPNPFNPTTTIKFSIPSDNQVSLKVYNVLGKEVASLLNDYISAGFYTADFNASNLSSGIYFYQIKAGSFTATKKMTMIK